MADLKVLLIQHPTPRTAFNIHLGLGYVASVLKSKGAEVKIVDAGSPYRAYNNQDIVNIIEEEHFDIVGVTITTLFTGFAYDLIREIVKHNTLVVAGGPHATLFPHEPLGYGAKISVIGEGEKIISDIADYCRGEKDIADILGISYVNENGKIIDNAPREFIENLDEILFPDRGAFIYQDYVRNEKDVERFGSILTSRGCPGRCSFCSKKVFGDNYRYRSPENIVDEIRFLYKKYRLKHFAFIDDAMTCNSKRVDVLCDYIKTNLDVNITWSCVTRVDFINTDLLKKMKNSGCVSVTYGIESANPRTLKKIRKDISIEKIEDTLGKTREAGIDYAINFMWGYPWESINDIKNSINFMKKISTHACSIMQGGVLIPFPDTELYETYKDEYGFQEWWLKRDTFTGKYRIQLKSPLFRNFFFNDQGMLENKGFFNYSQGIKKEIKKAAYYIGQFKLRKQKFMLYLFGMLFIALSYWTYAFSYRAEIVVQKLFFFLLYLKNAGRKLD